MVETMIVDYFVYFLAFVVFLLVGITFIILIKKRKNKEKIISKSNQTILDIQDQLINVNTSLQNLPRSNEVDLISEKLIKIEENFDILNADVTKNILDTETTVTTMNRQFEEKLSLTEQKILNETTKKILEKATMHITETSVNKTEFDALKSRIETLIGAEIDAKRLHHLKEIFGDTDRKDVLSWKCKLITLLRGGLAPEAEEDVLISDGISISKAKKFLKELTNMGIVDQKKIESYWLNDDFEWLNKYMDDVELLIHRIKQSVKNEKNYEIYIKKNLDLIEDGLIFESEQYFIDSENKVDLVCTDKNGIRLFLELKYPKAIPTDKFQLVRYREVYNTQSPGVSARFMLISPSIPSKTQEIMNSDGLEFRELSF